MGATAGKMGPQRDTYTLPKVLAIVDPGEPTAGTEGSIVNHAGFSPDIAAMQKWYVETFVAKPAEFGEVKIATLPGATLLFSSTDIAGGPHPRPGAGSHRFRGEGSGGFLEEPGGGRCEV
jgi:hypothetical protein